MLILIINFLIIDHDKAKIIILDQIIFIEWYMINISTDYCNVKKLSNDTLIPIRFSIIQWYIKAWKQYFIDIEMHELLFSKLVEELKSNVIKENMKEIEMIDSISTKNINETQRFEKNIELTQFDQILIDINIYLFL